MRTGCLRDKDFGPDKCSNRPKNRVEKRSRPYTPKLLLYVSITANRNGYHGSGHGSARIIGRIGHLRAGLLARVGQAAIAPTGQIFVGGFRAAPAAGCNPKRGLQIGQRGGALGYSRLDLSLGDGITDANEHENNYYLTQDKNQSHLNKICQDGENSQHRPSCSLLDPAIDAYPLDDAPA